MWGVTAGFVVGPHRVVGFVCLVGTWGLMMFFSRSSLTGQVEVFGVVDGGSMLTCCGLSTNCLRVVLVVGVVVCGALVF